jgi:flagellar biosynthesis anti-sigma factor FlgM
VKIHGVNRPRVHAAVTARPAAKRGVSHKATRVAVSSQAKQLAQARSPHVSDAAKVQRLLAAVARGEFMVSAESVTERMMSEER